MKMLGPNFTQKDTESSLEYTKTTFTQGRNTNE